MLTITRKCATCEQPFTEPRRVGHGGRPPAYCGDTCRTARQRARRAASMRRSRREIAEQLQQG